MSDKPQSYGLDFEIEQDQIETKVNRYKIEASEPELALIAERFDLPLVRSFSALVEVYRKARIIVVRADLKADLQQTCVLSLEDFDVRVEDQCELELVPAEEAEIRDTDENYLFSDLPEYDELEEGPIYVGEIIVQSLGLALEPHPRKPGMDLEAALKAQAPTAKAIEVNAAPQEKKSPFDALKALKGDE